VSVDSKKTDEKVEGRDERKQQKQRGYAHFVDLNYVIIVLQNDFLDFNFWGFFKKKVLHNKPKPLVF